MFWTFSLSLFPGRDYISWSSLTAVISSQCAVAHWWAVNGWQVCHRSFGGGPISVGRLEDVIPQAPVQCILSAVKKPMLAPSECSMKWKKFENCFFRAVFQACTRLQVCIQLQYYAASHIICAHFLNVHLKIALFSHFNKSKLMHTGEVSNLTATEYSTSHPKCFLI